MEPYDQKPRPTSYDKPRNTGKIILAVVAFAAIALAVGVANNTPDTLSPVANDETAMGGSRVYDDPAARSASSIEPAEGEAFREPTTTPSAGMPATAPVATPSDVVPPAVATSPAVAVPPPVQTYATEQECKDATSTACHATECSSGTDLAACGAADKKGWQAVTPAMDKTAVPEQVNPPLTGQ